MSGAAPDGESRALAAVQGVSLAVVAGLALEVDRYFATSPGGALPLPPRAPLGAAAAALAVVGLALSLAAWRGRVVGTLASTCAFGLALVVLALGCPSQSAPVHAAATAVAGVAGIVALARAASGWSAAGRARRVTARVLAVALAALALELLASLLPRTHAVGYTLASRMWYGRYWPPVNALGYRDAPHVDRGGVRLFVLGDSFVAGVGIEDPDDRMTGALQDSLIGEGSHTNVQVYNLGGNGSDTRDELWRLGEHPLAPPDVLVLVYYVNDILGAAADHGVVAPAPTPYGDLAPWAARLVRRSYLLDGLYWQAPHADLAGLAGTLERAFADPATVEAHERDLMSLVAYARRWNVALFIVAFPRLTEPGDPSHLLAPIRRVAEQGGVPLLDLSTMLRDADPRDLVVNANDAHPNERLQGRVGRWIYEGLRANHLVEGLRIRHDAPVDP